MRIISQKPMQLRSPNLTHGCATMSPGNPFILGSKGQKSRSWVTEKNNCRRGSLHSCESWLLLVHLGVQWQYINATDTHTYTAALVKPWLGSATSDMRLLCLVYLRMLTRGETSRMTGSSPYKNSSSLTSSVLSMKTTTAPLTTASLNVDWLTVVLMSHVNDVDETLK